MAGDRLDILKQRYQQAASSVEPEAAQQAARKIAAVAPTGRGRGSLYMSEKARQSLDRAYKREAASLYAERELEFRKADYLEACIEYALAHPDEVRAVLLKGLAAR